MLIGSLMRHGGTTRLFEHNYFLLHFPKDDKFFLELDSFIYFVDIGSDSQ